MKKIFVTFASSNLYRSLKRINKQAINLDIYDEIFICDEHDLSDTFTRKFKKKLNVGTRGFGYWAWKPQILLQILSKMDEGDVLQYTDAGCHLNITGINRLKEYFNLAQNSLNGILAFQAGKPYNVPIVDDRVFPSLPDREWIKGDLLDYFDVRHNDEVLNSATIGAGIIFIRKCPESLGIIEEWLNVIKYDFRLIDDSPSLSPNLSTFKEHRHDQAIFSLLCKKYGVTRLSACEYWYPSSNFKKGDWAVLKNYPIHAVRDIDRGFWGNFIDFLKRGYNFFIRRVKKICA